MTNKEWFTEQFRPLKIKELEASLKRAKRCDADEFLMEYGFCRHCVYSPRKEENEKNNPAVSHGCIGMSWTCQEGRAKWGELEYKEEQA